MSPIDPGPHDLSATRPILGPRGEVTLKTVTPDFYAELDRAFPSFAGHLLVQQFAFEEPWPTWEMHPEGDELVYLLEGDVDLLFAREEGEPRVVRVDRPGRYVIVPRGTWHTARPHTPTTLLFVTPGEATRNEVEPPVGTTPR